MTYICGWQLSWSCAPDYTRNNHLFLRQNKAIVGGPFSSVIVVQLMISFYFKCSVILDTPGYIFMCRIRTEGEVGSVKHVKALSSLLLTIPRPYLIVVLCCLFCLFCAVFILYMVKSSSVTNFWGKSCLPS